MRLWRAIGRALWPWAWRMAAILFCFLLSHHLLGYPLWMLFVIVIGWPLIAIAAAIRLVRVKHRETTDAPADS